MEKPCQLITAPALFVMLSVFPATLKLAEPETTCGATGLPYE